MTMLKNGIKTRLGNILQLRRNNVTALRNNWATSLLVLLSLLVPALLVTIHSPKTSPVDEWVFIDYTSKVLSQGFVREGERVGEFTANLMACDGVFTGGIFGKCGGGSANLDELPYGGINAAAAYTPLYFASTAIFAMPLTWAGVDPLIAWRMTGSIWLCGAMVFFIAALRRFGASEITIFSSGLLLISAPLIWWSNTFVSTDSPSTFFGIAMFYFALRGIRGEGNQWVLALVLAAGVLFKVTNLVAVGFIGTYALALFFTTLIGENRQSADRQKLRKGASRTLFTVVGSGMSAIALIIVWQRFIRENAVPGPTLDQGISADLNFTELASQAFSFLPMAATVTPFSGKGVDFLWAPLGLLLVAGVVGVILSSAHSQQERLLAGSTFVASLITAPLLGIAIVVATGSYFQMPPRYGAALVPLFLISLSFLLRERLSNFLAISVGIYGVAGGFALAFVFA